LSTLRKRTSNPINDGLNVVLFDLNINAANFPTTKIVKTKKKKTRKFTEKKKTIT